MDSYRDLKCTPHMIPPLPKFGDQLKDSILDSDESGNIFFLGGRAKGAVFPVVELLAIETIQKATGIKLSPALAKDARKAISELTCGTEITMLAIVEALEKKPSLRTFAERVRRVLL